METRGVKPRTILVIRWIARIWSILVFVFVLLQIFTPDPYATQPVPLEDWFLLSLWGIAVLGLLVAWRWELAGGILTIAVMFLRELAWIVLKGAWLVNFLIVWLFLVPPAVLFLIAWGLERKEREASV
jgi:hypothetical protein